MTTDITFFRNRSKSASQKPWFLKSWKIFLKMEWGGGFKSRKKIQKHLKNSRKVNQGSTVGYLSSVDGLYRFHINLWSSICSVEKFSSSVLGYLDSSTEKEVIRVHPELRFHLFHFSLGYYLNNELWRIKKTMRKNNMPKVIRIMNARVVSSNQKKKEKKR